MISRTDMASASLITTLNAHAVLVIKFDLKLFAPISRFRHDNECQQASCTQPSASSVPSALVDRHSWCLWRRRCSDHHVPSGCGQDSVASTAGTGALLMPIRCCCLFEIFPGELFG